MALYSLFKLTALCALFQAAAAAGTPACSGTRTETYQPSSPDGVYSQSDIDVYGAKVKYIDVVFHPVCAPPALCIVPLSETVTYKMDLEGCVIVGDMCMPFPGEMHKTFNDGRFIDSGNNQGAMFIPRSSEPLNPINELLKIHWCPDQNYFLVKLAGQLLEPLRHQATVFSAVSPLADASGPDYYPGSSCAPGLLGACGSTANPPSGLTCVAKSAPPPFILTSFKCEPSANVGSSCIPGAPGSCGAGTRYPSGLACLPIEFPPPLIGSSFKCLPKSAKPYIDTVCSKDAVGTCGSTLYPDPSGLTCQCEVFGCKCRPAVA